MTDIITFFLNFNYDICLAADNLWTVEEAVDYLAAFLANKENWYATEDAYKAFLCIKDQLYSSVRQSILAGSLHLCETSHDRNNDAPDLCSPDFKKLTLVPLDFINWAISNNISVPKQFEQYAASKKRQQSGGYEGLTLKRNTICHERCRAVAELLWSMWPKMTINEMARRPEITQFGCMGHEYDTRTIARWLATLKTDRRPGNPGHNKMECSDGTFR